MKLFAIKKPDGSTIKDLSFADKTKAKAARDELNKKDAGHTVTYGPDHHRFKRAQ